MFFSVDKGSRGFSAGTVAASAIPLMASLLFALPCDGGTVTKKRLDPMNVQYEGLELNGDDYDDAVLVNVVSGEKQLFLGTPTRNLARTRFASLTPEEKQIIPDMLTEVDLDGDRVNDLVVVNREKLFKASDERGFIRVLEYSVFFGQKDGSFKNLRFSGFTDEQREALVKNARLLLLPADGPEGKAPELHSTTYK